MEIYSKCINVVKKASFIGLMLFLTAISQKSFSQAATATWALTANANVVTTGNIIATSHSFSTGLNVPTYDATYGARATNFGGGYCTPTMTKYYEYTLSPSGCNDLEVTLVTFIGRSSAASRCFQMFYSISGGPETQIGGSFNMTASNTDFNFSSGAISIIVSQGQTIRLRLYGSGSTASTLGSRNFQVTGTTSAVTAAPTVVISAAPSSTVCSGTSVAFTATPTLGGTTPSYQWKLNGSNVGANSPNYTNASLSNGNTISCVMTSNSPCASPTTATSNVITMIVNSAPASPGVISGPASTGPGVTGLAYSIAAVSGATSYNWSLPVGWLVTGGTGTVAITVTSGAIGQNGNITVTATGACGTSAASTLAVTVSPPHNVCSQCHINHTSAGMQLTTVNGNANLCMSCHTAAGLASSSPFSNSDKAVPGVSGNSHSWNANTVNATYQTNAPANAQMSARVYSNQIVCSTCHDQHSTTYSPFLRIANTEDALCLQCHTARDIRRYADNVSNKGTHPVGINYSLADSRFQLMSLPLSTSSKVVCSTCHATHYSASADGNILRNASKDNLCATCHTYLGFDITLNHKGMSCTTCHYGHSNGSANIYLINDNIVTPNSGTKAAVFTANGSGSNYADGTGTINGVCEVCHTQTDHFTNTAIGTVDARHIVSPVVKCTTCHPHNKAFAAQTDCLGCHNTVQDKPGVGPVGGRRAVVGASGDFVRTSHHSNTAPTVADCIKCHYMGDHKDGNVKLLDPDLGYANVFTYDPANKSSVESFCLKCHDANGSNGDVTPFSDGVTVPVVDAAMWAASSHKGAASTSTCLNCHDNGHGSNKRNLLGPATYAGPGTGTDLMNEEEGLCLTCHGAAGLATVKVHLAFSTYTNTATNFFKHDPTATYRKHVSGETGGASFTGTNRHVECVDCHNPHGAKAGTATAPTLLPTMIGATGAEPIYAGAGAPTGFTWQASVTQEYQVCFKCHSSYTTLPTYLPGGYQNAAAIADGLKKLTTGGTNNQIADNRDMAQEYNPNNISFHPIMAAGKNLNINATAFQAGWSYTSRMYCSDCHGNPNATTAGHGNGPHGSVNLHLLDKGIGGAAQYPTYHSTNPGANIVCTKCHVSGRTDTGSRFNYHNYHLSKSACYDCHDSHGSEREHLMNFSRNAAGCITAFGASPYNTSQSAFNHVAGTATNACVVTCHGTGHSTGSKTYNPSYN